MNYRMTDEEHAELLEASRPVTYMVVGGIAPESPYDKAMRVWGKICDRLGCQPSTVAPGSTGDDHDFTAEPL